MATNCCVVCNSKATFHCSVCKQVYYCNRECQKKDWSTHKSTCEKVSPQDKNTLEILIESLEKTSIIKKLSCLKQYSMLHNLGKGSNCFSLLDLSIANYTLLTTVQNTMKLPSTANVYLVTPEEVVGGLPTQFIPESLFVGLSTKSGKAATIARIDDVVLANEVVEETVLAIFTSKSRVKQFFSTNANGCMLLLIPDRDTLFLMHLNTSRT